MSEMRQRVAKAIEATMFAPHELPITGELHERYLEATSAAIAAMREPTEEMILAGIHHEHMGDMEGRWKAMIDAAK